MSRFSNPTGILPATGEPTWAGILKADIRTLGYEDSSPITASKADKNIGIIFCEAVKSPLLIHDSAARAYKLSPSASIYCRFFTASVAEQHQKIRAIYSHSNLPKGANADDAARIIRDWLKSADDLRANDILGLAPLVTNLKKLAIIKFPRTMQGITNDAGLEIFTKPLEPWVNRLVNLFGDSFKLHYGSPSEKQSVKYPEEASLLFVLPTFIGLIALLETDPKVRNAKVGMYKQMNNQFGRILEEQR